MRRIVPSHSRAGFTVIELLVSMAVFSVVLLVVTVGIMQISRVYYKGVTEVATQDVARSIVDVISQSIQFNGGTITNTPSPVAGSSRVFCVDSQEYSYRLGYKLVDSTPGVNQTNHSLVLRTVAACSGTGQDLSGAVVGRELLAPHMRLAHLEVERQGTTNLYRVHVRVVYGDDDLLYSPSGSPAGALATDASCLGQAGREFCAVSDLSTVVISRVK